MDTKILSFFICSLWHELHWSLVLCSLPLFILYKNLIMSQFVLFIFLNSYQLSFFLNTLSEQLITLLWCVCINCVLIYILLPFRLAARITHFFCFPLCVSSTAIAGKQMLSLGNKIKSLLFNPNKKISINQLSITKS